MHGAFLLSFNDTEAVCLRVMNWRVLLVGGLVWGVLLGLGANWWWWQ